MTSRWGFRVLALCVVMAALCGLCGCVTKTAAPSTVPAVTFAVSPPGSVMTGSQTQLVAMLSTDPQNMGVNWVASCQSTDCGSFNPVNTPSGIQTVYTAPKTVPQGCNSGAGPVPCVSLTASAASSPSQTATVTISVVSGISISLTTVPVGQVPSGGTTQVGATVSGSATAVAQGVSWQIINCTTASCGTLPLTSNSGVPVTYKAPASVTAAFTFQIQAGAVADPNQIVNTATISVVPGAVPTVQFTTVSSTNIQPSGTVTLVASVSNDTNPPQGVDWAVQCTNSASTGQCGSFNPSGTPPNTASGAQMVYTAPTQAQIPQAGLTVTIQAYPASNPSDVITQQVTISLPTISISFSAAPPTSLQVSQKSSPMSAAVANDPTTGGGVDWSVSCSDPNCGTFSNGSTTIHTADAQSGGSTTFTAPSAIPTGGTVTIKACATAAATTCVQQSVQIVSSTTVTISWTSGAPPSQIVESQQLALNATVSPNTDTGGTDWMLSCTSGPSGSCGTFATTSACAAEPCTTAHTASAVAVTYTAPPDLPGTPITITATATDNNAAKLTANVSIVAPTPVVTLSQIPTTMEVGTSLTITATITNDEPPPNDGATWSCTPSGSCGTFSNLQNQKGSSSVTYTAPAAVPSSDSGKVTITATSVANTTATASTNPPIQITPNPNLSLLNGNYVFAVSGTPTNGSFYGLAGAFTADGQGNISQFEEDFAGQCGPAGVTSGPGMNGTYEIGPDGRGTIALPIGGTGSCLPTTETFSFVIVGGPNSTSPRALITEFDANSASGRIDAQTNPVPEPSGSYAYLLNGYDIQNVNVNDSVSTTDIGGVISISGNSYSIEQDINDQGLAPQSGVGTQTKATNGWTYGGSLDSYGRGTVSRDNGNFQLVFYVANSGFIQLLEDDTSYVEAGTAYTSANTAPHGPYVFTFSGVDNTQANTALGVYNLLAIGGSFTAGSGGLSGAAVDVNDGGTLTSNSTVTGATFTNPSSGRGTMTVSITPVTAQPSTSSFIYYPTANNGILILNADAATGFAGIGTALPQTATPIFAAGNYGMDLTNATGGAGHAEEDIDAQVISDGTGHFTGTADVNDNEGSNGGNSGLFQGTPLTSSSYGSATGGRFTGSFNLELPTAQKIQQVFYVVDSTPAPLTPQDVAIGQLTSSSADATCSQAGACLALTLPAGTKSIGVALSNPLNAQAFTATAVFEVSSDGGTSWSAATCSPSASQTAASLTVCAPAGGTTTFRVRVSSYTQGTVVATIIADTTESTFGPGSSASDPNGVNPVPSCSTSDTTLSQLLYFDTSMAQLFYCTTPQGAATSSWGQFTGVGPSTVLFLEMDEDQQTTGIMRLQSLP